MVERDHLAALGEPPQRIQVGMRPDLDVGGDKSGAVVRTGGEYPQRLAEPDGGLMGHASQLAAAHHADDGEASTGVHGADSLPATAILQAGWPARPDRSPEAGRRNPGRRTRWAGHRPAAGLPAAAGPGASGVPDTTTAPGGASRQAAARRSRAGTGDERSPPARPASRWRRPPPIRRAAESVPAAARRRRARHRRPGDSVARPVSAVYVTSASVTADAPDGVAPSVGSAGRVTSASASLAVS